MKIKLTEKNTLIIHCAVMAVLLYLRNITNIFIYPAVIYGIITILFCRKKLCLPFLLFLLPFSSVYKFAPRQISIFTVMFAIFILRILSSMKVSRNFLWLLISFTVYAAALSGISKIIYTATLICGFFMINYVCRSPDCDFKISVYTFTAGLITAAVLGLFRNSLPILRSFVHYVGLWQEGNIYTRRFTGLDADPNYYNMNVVTALSCLLVMIFKEKKSLINVLLFSVLSLFGLLTISKSFILIWLLLLVILVIQAIRAGAKKAVTALLVFLIGGALAYLFASEAIDMFVYRFTGAKTQSFSQFTTGRGAIWKMYFERIFSESKILFLGAGINTLVNGRASHNMYIQVLYSLGLIGGAIYLLTLRYSVSLPKTKKKELLIRLPLFMLLIQLFALDGLTNDNLPFLFSLICLIVRFYHREDKNNMECASG